MTERKGKMLMEATIHIRIYENESHVIWTSGDAGEDEIFVAAENVPQALEELAEEIKERAQGALDALNNILGEWGHDE